MGSVIHNKFLWGYYLKRSLGFQVERQINAILHQIREVPDKIKIKEVLNKDKTGSYRVIPR